MNKLIFAIVTILLLFLVDVPTASAHQPQYTGTETSVQIPDPNISRAYYGELTGKPAVYTITLEKDFSLYLNILSPYLPGAKKDFIVSLINSSSTTIATTQSPASDWQKWYEDFAGDYYWKGPEFKQTEPAGTYTIEVSNPSNSGKYVLAPGEEEAFTLAGTPSTIHQLYIIKTLFFGKPWYAIFQGIIGKSLLYGLIGILLILLFIFWLLYRRTNKRV